ncbi:ubiquitin-conjugating enzyme E2 J2-like [Condylostylus longicornis]|uniref:ubiquitin-conjugating enzyme E2 J2-like n=1 Tax=Condylostylus longicornis TaxID=2530218 RepID=UPI00244DF77A|nr:ubiquitin-conjugating enzyme E2 J2-like [Condylostylus longicornis]
MNKKRISNSRLQQEYLRLKKDPVPYIYAEPLPSNILEWHYVIKGPEDSPYFCGYYHGKLLFSNEYPFKPPSIYMFTPNGRFKTNTKLCLSISDFHSDTWNPSWSVATILIGLLNFMLDSIPTLGSITSSLYEKKMYAKNSLKFNLKNSNFRELFPNLVDEMKELVLKEQPIQNNFNNKINFEFCNYCQSICSNLIIIVGSIIFALIVNYILKNLNRE